MQMLITAEKIQHRIEEMPMKLPSIMAANPSP